MLTDSQRDADLQQLRTPNRAEGSENVFVQFNTAGRGTETLEAGERWATAVAVDVKVIKLCGTMLYGCSLDVGSYDWG